MITIINEKHEQAENFAKSLGGRTGTLPTNSNLSGPYVIDEAAGHLMKFKDLKEMVPDELQDEFMSWNSDDLPFDRKKINWQRRLKKHGAGRGAEYYMSAFQKDLAKSDTVIIATDLDPSGEGNLIGWEIIKHCNFTGDVYRCEHEDETPTKILDAFKHLKPLRLNNGPINDPDYAKAEARTRFDYLTIQYSRLITDTARKCNVILTGYLARAGRLKSAMLELVGHQERLHDYFKPHSDFQPALFDADGHRFVKDDAPFYDSAEEANKHFDELPQNATSIEIGVKNLAQKPPKMLNLSQVAARLANKGYSPKIVNQLAETLFQKGILSYPRTPDEKITKDQLNELKPLVPQICDLIGVDQGLIDINNYRSYLIGTGLSHGANRPGTNVPDSLEQLESDYGKTAVALYEELARSFLSGFGSNKLFKKHLYTDSQTKEYKASAIVVTDPGFTLIMHEQKEDTGREQENTHLFTLGQTLKPDVWEKKKVRPRLATQKMLTDYLKKHNIGTGATQLTTYLDITDDTKKARQLVDCKKNKLRLTNLGKISYLLMHDTDLASPKITKQLENYLEDIANGKITQDQLLAFFDKMIAHDKPIIMKNKVNLSSLPKVKTNTHNKVKGLYKPTGKEVTISDGFGAYTFTKKDLDALFNGDSISFPSKDAIVTGKLMDRDKYGFGFKGEFKYPQPEQAKGYSSVAKKDVSFNKTFAGHTFTQGEIDSILDGNTVKFKAKSKAGKKYTAEVKLVYGEPFNSKTHNKIWHIGFANNKKTVKKK